MSISLLPRLALAAIALLAAGCGRGRPPAPAPAPVPVLQPSVLYDDDAGGMRDSVRLVVRDPAAFQALWRSATQGQPSPPPLPVIDFAREMVVAVGAGRMSPDDRIRVDSVSLRPEAGRGARPSLVVLVRTTEGCRGFSAASWPVQLVRVRRHDGPVVFVERRVRAEGCARA